MKITDYRGTIVRLTLLGFECPKCGGTYFKDRIIGEITVGKCIGTGTEMDHVSCDFSWVRSDDGDKKVLKEILVDK